MDVAISLAQHPASERWFDEITPQIARTAWPVLRQRQHRSAARAGEDGGDGSAVQFLQRIHVCSECGADVEARERSRHHAGQIGRQGQHVGAGNVGAEDVIVDVATVAIDAGRFACQQFLAEDRHHAGLTETVRMLHMPGELFVEYQLAAHRMRPDLDVMLAAYGDLGPGSIGTAASYGEGGYEVAPTSSFVGPDAEEPLTATMRTLLQAGADGRTGRAYRPVPLKSLVRSN